MPIYTPMFTATNAPCTLHMQMLGRNRGSAAAADLAKKKAAVQTFPRDSAYDEEL